MKHLGRFLAFVLSLALSLAILIWVFNNTIGNPDFLRNGSGKTQLYEQLATGLPPVVAKANGDQPEVQTALEKVLTPAYLKQLGNSLIPQFVDHYRHGAPAPTIDLRDVQVRLQQAGVPVPPDLEAQFGDTKTVSAGAAESTLANTSRQAGNFQWIAPAICVVLILIIAIVMRRRRWATLTQASIMSAVSMLLVAGAALLLPALTNSLVGKSLIQPLAPALTTLVRFVGLEISKELFIAAAILLLSGLMFGLLGGMANVRQRFSRPRESDDKPAARPFT